MENVILRCLQCNELFRPTRYDSYPAFYFDKDTGSVEETPKDDLNAFMTAHEGHEVASLRIIDESLHTTCSYWKPLREDYLQVTDGSRVYTVKRWRKDINEPLRYELVNAHIELSEPIVHVQSADLKKQMIYDSDKLRLDEDEIDRFIKGFEDFVSKIELDDIVECGISAEDPTVSYAAMKAETVEKFLARCKSMFTDEELERLGMFIEENSEYNDVMNLQVIRPFQVIVNGSPLPSPSWKGAGMGEGQGDLSSLPFPEGGQGDLKNIRSVSNLGLIRI